MNNILSFSSEVWEYGGKGSWYFVSVPINISEAIAEMSTTKRAFGSVKVYVSVANSKWLTSLFPDSKKGIYILPLKKEVRIKNNIKKGMKIKVNLRLVNE